MTEAELRDLGEHYRRAIDYRRLCHRLASQIAGRQLECLALAEAQAEELATMDSLTVGVLLMCDWGAVVPPELMAKAYVVPNFRLDPMEIIH